MVNGMAVLARRFFAGSRSLCNCTSQNARVEGTDEDHRNNQLALVRNLYVVSHSGLQKKIIRQRGVCLVGFTEKDDKARTSFGLFYCTKIFYNVKYDNEVGRIKAEIFGIF